MKELIEEYGTLIAVIVFMFVVVYCFGSLVSLVADPSFWVNYYVTG